MVKKNDVVVVVCAHSDDQIFGPGGTIAKYAAEGKEVYTVIFSYGESSHIWLKRKVTVEMRVKESIEADKVIGGSGVSFFGLKEGKFIEEAKKLDIRNKLLRIIEEKKPKKIFTHSNNDPHPDHKNVFDITLSALKKYCKEGPKTIKKPDIYTFDVWTPVKIKDRDQPKMIVNISKTFGTKLKALKCFESQWMTMIALLWSVYVKAIKNGIFNGHLFAEKFYKYKL